MKNLKLIDYWLIVGTALIVLLLGWVIVRPDPACYASLDVTKGQNFDQPIFTTHYCEPGERPVNIDDFLPKEN